MYGIYCVYVCVEHGSIWRKNKLKKKKKREWKESLDCRRCVCAFYVLDAGRICNHGMVEIVAGSISRI
jgi:hypothetical protein